MTPSVTPSVTPSITAETPVLGGVGTEAPAPSPRGGGTGGGSVATEGNPSPDAAKGAPASESKSNSPSAAVIVANSSAIVQAGANSGNAAYIANATAGLVQPGNGVPTATNLVNGAVVVAAGGLAAVPVNGVNGVNGAALPGAEALGESGLGGLRVLSPQSAVQSRSGQRVWNEVDDGRMAPVAAASSAAAQVDLVEATQATGLALTAGTVWWALRAGGLLAGLVVTLPAWRHADLLAVLPDPSQDGEDNDAWDKAEDDEAARDEKAVRQMLETSSEREPA